MGFERGGLSALRVVAEGAGLVLGVAAVIAGAGVVGVTVAAPPVTSQGPLPGVAECAGGYVPEALAERAFAFDGTVAAVGQAADPDVPVVPVTFEVHGWFHGGKGQAVTVDMAAPLVASGLGGARRGPSYGVGTRLLVSGEAPEDAKVPVAWGCGFTRYHDVATAAAWAALD